MHDLKFFYIDNIEKIELIKKTTYGCKITLKKPFKHPKDIIIFQLYLGSDYRKEVNTLLNHFKLGMEYSNRLFTVKRYKGGKLRYANIIDITEIVVNKVMSNKRKINDF